MPFLAKDAIEVACPKCGAKQYQSRTAYSTICRECREHFRVQEALRPAAQAAEPDIQRRLVCCFQCGSELEVPATAESSMCKRCSCHIDLADYQIARTVSKSFRTHGRLIIEEKGYVLNTEALVREAVIKGRLIGRLEVKGTLEIHSTAEIRGTFTAGKLVIPAGQHFHWREMIHVGEARIAGELAATLQTAGTVYLEPTARYFGDIRAANLVVEAGAVFVGSARIGSV